MKVAFALVLLLSPTARSAEPPASTPSETIGGGRHEISEIVQWAISHSDLVASHDARIREKSLRAEQARQWSNPSLSIQGGGRSLSSSSGPLFQASGSQPLSIWGKLHLRGESLEAEAEIERLQKSATEIDVASRVIHLAFEYVAARRKTEYAEKRQQRFELIRAYLSGRVFASPQKKTESWIVEQRLRSSSAEAVQTRAALASALSELEVYALLPPGTTPEIAIPAFTGTRALSEEEWAGRVLAGNPDRAIQQLTVKQAGLDRSSEAREAWPDPSLGVFYDQATAGDTERDYGVGLSLDLPFWNRNRHGIQAAEQKVAAEERVLQSQSRTLRGEARRLLTEYEASRQMVQRYPSSLVDVMEKEREQTETAFRKGQVDLLTFLELDDQVLETVNRSLEAQTSLADRITGLLALAGEKEIASRLASFEQASQ